MGGVMKNITDVSDGKKKKKHRRTALRLLCCFELPGSAR